MAESTVWKSMDTLPDEKLVIVYDRFHGYALRKTTHNGVYYYDEHGSYDDSEIEWDVWADLPDEPGPPRATEQS